MTLEEEAARGFSVNQTDYDGIRVEDPFRSAA